MLLWMEVVLNRWIPLPIWVLITCPESIKELFSYSSQGNASAMMYTIELYICVYLLCTYFLTYISVLLDCVCTIVCQNRSVHSSFR